MVLVDPDDAFEAAAGRHGVIDCWSAWKTIHGITGWAGLREAADQCASTADALQNRRGVSHHEAGPRRLDMAMISWTPTLWRCLPLSPTAAVPGLGGGGAVGGVGDAVRHCRGRSSKTCSCSVPWGVFR